jgi:hypothetical protein
MKLVWNWIKDNPNRSMFLVPILLVAGISISHVVTWYDMANPINWAIYLSIAIEVGAITALVAATNRIKGGIWFMFGLVTFIQMIGNIFYSYKEIDANGELFKSWVELTGPIWELMGTETTDVVGIKRWLAFLEGGLLPIISLTSLHFFVKYEDPNSPKEEGISPKDTLKDTNDNVDEDYDPTKDDYFYKEWDVTLNDGLEDEPYEEKTHWQKEADRVWEKVSELKDKGVFTEPTAEELADEPTSLANSGYRERAEISNFEDDYIIDDEIVESYMSNSGDTKNLTEENDKVDDISYPSPNELLENALKRYKESKEIPLKNKRSDIKRID